MFQLIKILVSQEKNCGEVSKSLDCRERGLHECQVLCRHKCYRPSKPAEGIERISSEASKKKVASKRAQACTFIFLWFNFFFIGSPISSGKSSSAHHI